VTEDYFKRTDLERSPGVTSSTSLLTLSETLAVMFVIAAAISMRNIAVHLGIDNFLASLGSIAVIFAGACLAAWFQTTSFQPQRVEVTVRSTADGGKTSRSNL